MDVGKFFGDEGSPAQRLKKEIYQAWMNYLKAAIKQESNKPWNVSILESLSLSKSTMSLPSAETSKVNRRDLIKQRASLRRSKGPRVRKIEVEELRRVRDSLIQVPAGKALKDTVSIPMLTEVKSKLRRSQC